MRSPYPVIDDENDLVDAYRQIQRLRTSEDLPDYENLDQRFVAGRATERVPSGPTDVEATDNEGDIVSDGTYEYKLVDVSGNLRWDRRTLNVSW